MARLADHLVIMDGGRALPSGPLAETLARLDLPIRFGGEADAILEATLGDVDREWHLARMDFAGGRLWTRDGGHSIGKHVRVRVLARDVSLAREHPGESSIQNMLAGRVDAVADDEHPSLALVRVRVGDVMLISRVTKRAVASLGIEIGQRLWGQVKSVAPME